LNSPNAYDIILKELMERVDMKKIYFNELPKYYNQEIELHGFVYKIRDLQYVQFIILRDSSGKVQVTIEKTDAFRDERYCIQTDQGKHCFG